MTYDITEGQKEQDTPHTLPNCVRSNEKHYYKYLLASHYIYVL